MAGKPDILVTSGLDLAPLQKQLDAAVKMARDRAKLIADAMNAALRDSMKGLPKLPPVPKAPTGGGGSRPARAPKGDPATDPDAASRAQAAILAAEKRGAEMREALSKKSTAELIADMDRYQTAKKDAIMAINATDDKAVKAEIQRKKKAIEEELAMTSQLARKRKEVVEDGAGVGVGLLGRGRNLIGNAAGALLPALGGAAIGTAIASAVGTGSEVQAAVAELSAITGVAGAALDKMKQSARDMANEFGGPVTGQIDSMKGVLSRLGPELPTDQLSAVTRAINTMSAASGDDAAASMDALTTSLLQFQVPLDGSVDVGAEAARMMNVLAAGAKYGAAEIPQVADAIKVAGVAASGSKVSFEETSAAIQALAAGGKYGAEAGTALRNVLGKLSEGRFLPKDIQTELGKAGVDIARLSDTSLSFTERMRELNKISGDAALVTKLFGTENAAAAQIILRSVDSIDDLTKKMTGTNTATEQAAVRQQTFAAGWARFKAQMENVAIGLFDAIGPALGGLMSSVSGFVSALGSIGSFVADNATAFGLLGAAVGVFALAMNASTVAVNVQGITLKAHAILTKAVAAAQRLWNLAMSANPIGVVIAGLTALIGAYTVLRDLLTKTTGEKLEENAAEAKLVARQKESVKAKLDQATATRNLTGRYAELATTVNRTAEQEAEYKKIGDDLNGKYPGLIKNTDNFRTAIAGVSKINQEAAAQVNALTRRMMELDAKATEIANRRRGLQRDAARENLAGGLFDELKGSWSEDVASFFGASSVEKAADKLATGWRNRLRAALMSADPEKAWGNVTAGILGEIGKFKIDATARENIAKLADALFETYKRPWEKKIEPPAIATATETPNTNTTPTGTAEEKSALDVSDKVNAIYAKGREQRTASEIAAVEDETARTLAEIRSRYQGEIDAAKASQQELNQTLKDKEANQTLEPVKVLDAAGEVIETLTTADEIIKQTEAQTAATVTGMAEARERALTDALKKGLADRLAAMKEAADEAVNIGKQELEDFRRDNPTLIGEAFSMEETLLQQEEAAAINAAIFSLGAFREQVAPLYEQLTSGALKPEQFDAAFARVRESFIANADATPELKRLFEHYGTLREDLYRRELDAAHGGSAAEKKAQEQTSDWWEIGVAIREGLMDRFYKRLDSKRKEELDKQKADLVKEESDLQSSLSRRQITYKEYLDRLNEVDDKRRAIEKEGGQEAFDFDAEIKAAGIEVTKRTSDTVSRITKKNAEDRERQIKALAIDEDATDAETLKKKEKRADIAAGLYEDLAMSAAASFAEMVANGEKAETAFLIMAMDTAAKWLEAMLPVWIAGHAGTSMADLGPLGLLTALAGIAVIEGLVAVAKAGLAKGRATGEVAIDGPGTATSDSIPSWLSRGESVITARATAAGRNADALRWANRTGRDLSEYYRPQLSASFFDPTRGMVVIAPDVKAEVQTQVVAAMTPVARKLDGIQTTLKAIKGSSQDTARNTNRTARNTGRSRGGWDSLRR